MRILVAGGAGYIGSALVPRLIERGYDVHVVDELWFGNHLPPGVRVLQQGVLSLHERDVQGFDQVICLAGLSNDPMAEYSPSLNFVENGASPAYLAYLAKRASVSRFIYGGSCSVYGYAVNEFSHEGSAASSNYPYGISKLQGEFGSMQLQDDRFSVIALRQGTVSGYSPRMRLDLIVNTMFKTAVQDSVITVNNPAIWRPILAIQDAVSAYVRAVEAPSGISGIFNVASGNFTVGEVADSVQRGLKEALGIEPRIEIQHIQDFRNYKVSVERAEQILSFRPRHDIESIVRELAQNMNAFTPFDQDQFYNIRTFKALFPGNAQ